jgi:uridine phosphorylase
MNYDNLNKTFQNLDTDYLYHLGLDSSMDLVQMFGDVKFVVFTRSPSDADYFAKQYTNAYYKLDDIEISCKTIAKDERYHIYKIANTLVISHGVGSPSMLICLNEVTKLLWHAKVTNFSYIRLSPGGGLSTDKAKIVIASHAVNHELKPTWANIEFGEYYNYDTQMATQLSDKILSMANSQAISGSILSSQSFYNGQARINGALPTSYNKDEARRYLQQAYDAGVRGIDMESGCFSAFCNQFEIPASIILATSVDRLNDDSITAQSFDGNNLDICIKNASNILINFLLSQGA